MKASVPRQFVLLVFVAFLAVASACKSRSFAEAPTDATQAAEYVSQADELYRQRDDLTHLREAIVFLRQAVTIDPANYDAAWRLAKFNYYLVTHTDDKEERQKASDEGINAGKAAVQLQGAKPDGHFWLGALYGAEAQRSPLAGLANVNDIRKEMETVLQLNQAYQDGSAYMVLGLVYLNEPRFVGGDPHKAVELMETGLRYGEGNAFLHLHLAEAYIKVRRPADARRQINTIISLKPDPNYLPEYNEALAQGRKLMERTGP